LRGLGLTVGRTGGARRGRRAVERDPTDRRRGVAGDGRLRQLEAVVAAEPHRAALVAGGVAGDGRVLDLHRRVGAVLVQAATPTVARGVPRDRGVEDDHAALATRGVVHAAAVRGRGVPGDRGALDGETLVEVVDVEAATRA